MSKKSLKERLGTEVLLADGAIGTLLNTLGSQRIHEAFCLSHPETVKNIHVSYIQAGADLIQTNTYAANYLKLERYGLQDNVHKINKSAVEIAREAVKGTSASVLGTIGGVFNPGDRVLNEYSLAEVNRSFREQLFVLLNSGVDGVLLETYYSVEELKTAIKIAREETDLPIFANVTMQEVGIVETGETLAQTLLQLRNLGADVVGANCVLSPSQMAQAFQNVPSEKGQILAVYPNSGLPTVEDGTIVYQNTTDHFKQYAEIFRQEGISVIGGCCGTTPEHISAIKEGLKSREILYPQKEISLLPNIVSKEKKVQELRIDDKVKNEITTLVELDPPRTLDTTIFFEGIKALKRGGADKITISDNSLARPRISNLALAAIIKEKYRISPLVHLTTRDHNLIGMTSQIMGFHQLEIFDILAITGDPAKSGNFPGASSVFDTTSFGLIEMIKRFNQGLAYTGKHLKETSDFKVGAAFNPNVPKLERAVRVLKRKQDAGADYILTQPIYDCSKIQILKKALKEYEITIPLFIGVQPLISSRNAEFLHNEISGILLSDEVRQRMVDADEKRKGIETGIEMSKEIIDEVLLHFNGIYLITPFQKYEISVELLHYINQKKRNYAENKR